MIEDKGLYRKQEHVLDVADREFILRSALKKLATYQLETALMHIESADSDAKCISLIQSAEETVELLREFHAKKLGVFSFADKGE